MILDVHTRIAAILHIVMGAFLLLAVAAIGPVLAAIGALGPSFGVDVDIAAWIGGVGILAVGTIALLSVTEIIGAVLLLRGRPAGRDIVVGFSVLSLLNIPFGTLAGAYSLWALLRDSPRPAADAAGSSSAAGGTPGVSGRAS